MWGCGHKSSRWIFHEYKYILRKRRWSVPSVSLLCVAFLMNCIFRFPFLLSFLLINDHGCSGNFHLLDICVVVVVIDPFEILVFENSCDLDDGRFEYTFRFQLLLSSRFWCCRFCNTTASVESREGLQWRRWRWGDEVSDRGLAVFEDDAHMDSCASEGGRFLNSVCLIFTSWLSARIFHFFTAFPVCWRSWISFTLDLMLVQVYERDAMGSTWVIKSSCLGFWERILPRRFPSPPFHR